MARTNNRSSGKQHHHSRRGGGRGGHGGGGGGGKLPREVTVSKKMSWVLRHGALKEGLEIDERGYVNVGELVSGSAFFLLLGLGLG